jgi:hypothetical protein
MNRAFLNSFLLHFRRVPRAFDLARITNKVGAPSFAYFAKGGSRECLRKFVDYPALPRMRAQQEV